MNYDFVYFYKTMVRRGGRPINGKPMHCILITYSTFWSLHTYLHDIPKKELWRI